MALTLYTGNSGTGKTTRITNEIRHDIEAKRQVILIVPEQQTVSVEREMATILPDSAPLYFEVVNFTRLADTYFRRHGGLAGGGNSPAVEQLLMWRTLSELAPFLHTKIEAEPKNVAKLRMIIKELRTMCMTPAVLSQAAALSEGALRDKLEDYALISSTYHALLEEHAGDDADHMDRLATLIDQNPLPASTKIYIDHFSSFTEQEYSVLEAILKHSDVTMALCVPPHAEMQLCASEVMGTLHALRKITAKQNCEVNEVKFSEHLRHSSEVRAFVSDRLFRIDYASLPPYTGEADDALRLIDCPDPQDACDLIAADIRKRVFDEGCKYADFAVVCGSSSSYIGILDAAFEKYEIPYFFSKKRELSTLEPIKMILFAYAVISNGWRREDVISYLKCVPNDLSSDARDELELYAETWNIHGARWYDGEDWNMNPFGYGEPHTEGQRTYAAAKLARVNAARACLVPPLSALGELQGERHSVTTHARALTQFLLSLDLPERLDRRAEALRGEGRKDAEDYARLWDTVCDTLDAMTSVIGDLTLSVDEFASLLRMLFSSSGLGAIPAALDEVTVGDARMLRAGEIRHVYLLGANEGEFPPPPSLGLSFTDGERFLLGDAGILSQEDTDGRAARELFSFWRAFNMARDSVTVLWSRAGVAMDAATPSDAVKRIRYLLGENYPISHITPSDIVASVSTVNAAREKIGQAGRTAEGLALRHILSLDEHHRGEVAALDEPICNDERALSSSLASALWSGDLAMTQARVQAFRECPFSYFCNYVLKLDTTARAEFDAMSVGNFIHALLEHFFRKLRERGIDPHDIPPEVQTEILDKVVDDVTAASLPKGVETSPRTQVFLASLRRNAAAVIDVVAEEFRHSRFTPAFFELNINTREADAPSPVAFDLPDGHRIYIYGTIDRVDTYTEGDKIYIRVVDYKTGVKKFSLADIAAGINLQLLLYLFAITETNSEAFRRRLGISENGEILPAAVLYLSSLARGSSSDLPPSEDTALSDITGAQRSGLIVNDRDLIDAMDDTPDKAYLPVTIKKDGEFDSYSLSSLTDLEALGILKEQIGDTLREIGAAMKSGVATAAPMQRDTRAAQETCKWCTYKAICRYTAPDRMKGTAEKAED